MQLAVIDSGLGGLAVVRALRASVPNLSLLYAADTAGFPYGKRTPEDINRRAVALVEALRAAHAVSHVVLACNTLSTLCLANLRTTFPALTFVGTVPAIKVAAAQTSSKRFSLLATPNTALSQYTEDLIAQFAADCVVDRYGAPNLAALAEATLLGAPVDAAAWRAELAPCFHDDARGKTDQVILGCTHYPLVLDQLRQHAPWPVGWIDSSPAIARQVLSHLTPATDTPSIAYVTGAGDVARYQPLFAREGLPQTAALPIGADQPPHANRG